MDAGDLVPPAEVIDVYYIGDATYSYTIGTQDQTGNVQYNVDRPLSSYSGLSLSVPGGFVDPSVAAGQISFTVNPIPPGPQPVAFTYSFTIQVQDQNTPTANEVFQEFTITVQRRPVSVAFVLDRSGSMGQRPVGSVDPADPTRMQILQTAASLFVNKMALTSINLDGDQLALTPFNATVDNPTAPGFANTLTTINGNAGSINTEISSLIPGGFTSMGEGLIVAKGELNAAASDNQQLIFLFTDGEQNTGRQVNENVVGPNQPGTIVEALGGDPQESLNNGTTVFKLSP